MPELAELEQTDQEKLRQERDQLLARLEELQAQDQQSSAQIQDAPPAELPQPPIMDAPPAGFIPPAPPVWAGSSTEAIDAFNAAPGRTSPAPNATQYAQEVARAQRGNGFINAEVGPGGNVSVPGYDPERDPVAQKALKAATDFQRNQYYGSLLAGGATPAEAFRASNTKFPTSGDLVDQVKVSQLLQKTEAPKLTTKTENGRTFYLNESGWHPLTEQKMIGGKLTEVARGQRNSIDDEIRSLRTELRTGTKPTIGLDKKLHHVPLTATEQAEKEGRIKTLNQQRDELLNRPEFNPAVDQGGWGQMKARFNAAGEAPVAAAPVMAPAIAPIVTTRTPEGMRIGKAAAPAASDEKVVVTKDGKRYRLPKSQLDDALKEGYKLGQ